MGIVAALLAQARPWLGRNDAPEVREGVGLGYQIIDDDVNNQELHSHAEARGENEVSNIGE
jgi:hypothetical protein